MKVITVFILFLTGCSANPPLYSVSTNPSLEWLTRSMNPKYASYDPCFSCGEGWGPQIPNKRFEDQRSAQDIDQDTDW